jgi:hypothetical protein
MDFKWSAKAPRLPRSPQRALEKIDIVVNSMNRAREVPAWMGRSNRHALSVRRAKAAAAATKNMNHSRSPSRSKRSKRSATRKPRRIGQLF